MATGTRAASRPQLAAGEGDRLVGCVRAVHSLEVRAVEAHTCIHVDQIRSEAGRECPLHLQYILATDCCWCDLSIRSCVDAGSIDDLA